MSEELSGITVVIIIGLGVLLFMLLFIFAKRQIMRFAIKSRRGPHVPIGHDAPKSLKREIERRINLIPRIVCEPRLLNKVYSNGQRIPVHYYRLKAIDDAKILEQEITKQDGSLRRHPSENLRAYLLTTLAAPMNGSGQRLIHQFCDMYEHARHDPNKFGEDEYQAYNKLFLKLLDAAKTLKSYNSRRSSPSRTPQKQKHQKQEKSHSLLDPSKLRPAPITKSDDEEVLCVTERRDPRPSTLSVPVPHGDEETAV